MFTSKEEEGGLGGGGQRKLKKAEKVLKGEDNSTIDFQY